MPQELSQWPSNHVTEVVIKSGRYFVYCSCQTSCLGGGVTIRDAELVIDFHTTEGGQIAGDK
jgi:hypothetical protein